MENIEEIKNFILWCKEQNADFVEINGIKIHFKLLSENNLMKSLEDFTEHKKTEKELKDEYRKLALYSSGG